jgi:hypothetical protein
MAGRLEMPNGMGSVGKRDTRRHAELIGGTGLLAAGGLRHRAVGPALAAGREYAREAGDVRGFSRIDRAANLRRAFLTGTQPYTPRIVRARPGLSALGGLALLAHSRRSRGARTTGP